MLAIYWNLNRSFHTTELYVLLNPVLNFFNGEYILGICFSSGAGPYKRRARFSGVCRISQSGRPRGRERGRGRREEGGRASLVTH